MANRILFESNWQERIRDKMGVDDAYLPDSAIGQPDIIDVAESNIIAMFPDHSTFEGDNVVYLEAMTVLECCILLSPSMAARLPKKETGPHAGHELMVNWDRKMEMFAEERDSLFGRLEAILNPDATADGLRGFVASSPERGW